MLFVHLLLYNNDLVLLFEVMVVYQTIKFNKYYLGTWFITSKHDIK
jgi:hypothetical protein